MIGRLRNLSVALPACALIAVACSKPRLTRVLPPGERVDVFPQQTAAQLDALFVIDNARYMAPHQAKVAESFHRFVAYLERNQIDWHVGLVSTDVAAAPGQFQGAGDRHYFAHDNGDALPQAVKDLGEHGGAIAPTLQQLDLALRDPPHGFLRPGAALFLVAVTDDDDPWSSQTDLYYYRELKQAKGAGNDGVVTYSALAGDVPTGCDIPDPQNPSQSFHAASAPRQQAFAARMGGLFHSICDPSFDQVFDDLGATAAGLKRNFRLARQPDLSTLQVSVRARCDQDKSALGFCTSISDECLSSDPALNCTPKQDAATGWQYDAPTNSVLFAPSAVPPRGSSVEVIYKEANQGAAQ